MIASKESFEPHSSEQLPASKKIYVEGTQPGVRVPMREIGVSPTKSYTGAVTPNDPVRVYDCSGPWGDPEFTGWGRVQTDASGHWTARTLRPGARGRNAPYLSVCVFARGLLVHLFTRIYLPGDAAALAADPLLSRVDEARRGTLIAEDGGNGTYRFDIRLQGENETVFFDV